MTSTEELRRLLDERGVEWTADDGEFVKETGWPYMGELTAAFAEYYDGTTRFACDTWCFTPEQAIEATLGRDTCHDIGTFKSWGLFTCSNCSIVIPLNAAKDAPRVGKSVPLKFCPNCGRRVKDE
jgi:hypothetical protein